MADVNETGVLIQIPDLAKKSPQDAAQTYVSKSKDGYSARIGSEKRIVVDDDPNTKYSLTKTNNMLNVFIRIFLGISIIMFVSILLYIFYLFPKHNFWEKMKPQAVFLLIIEGFLFLAIICMFVLRKFDEGKVVIYSFMLFFSGIATGVWLFLVFQMINGDLGTSQLQS